MAIQLSDAARNDSLDAFETTTGVTPFLDIRSGVKPANCAAGDAGTEIYHMALPSDWLAAASGGVKSKIGTWQQNAAVGGVAGHFRIKNAADSACHMQGSVTATGGGGDMEINNVNVSVGQEATVNTFSLTAGNA